MRRSLMLFAVVLTGCVAVLDVPAPQQPVVQLVQLRSTWRDPIAYGPVAVTYELTIFNPSERTIFVRAVDLHSVGSGHYHVAQQTRRLQFAIAPHETIATRVRVSAWANGGEASTYAPVTIHGALWFGRSQRVQFEATP